MEPGVSLTPSAPERVGSSDPQEAQKRLMMIDLVLWTPFHDYSSDVEALAPGC